MLGRVELLRKLREGTALLSALVWIVAYTSVNSMIKLWSERYT